MEVNDFAIFARRAVDIMCGIQAVFTVIQAALYNAGHHHTDGGNNVRAVFTITNAIGVACWLIWRPVF